MRAYLSLEILIIAGNVVKHDKAGRKGGTRGVFVGVINIPSLRGHCGKIGEQLVKGPVHGLLFRVVGIGGIALMKRNRAAHGFQVVAPSARSAGIDNEAGYALKQGVEIFQIALDVSVLSKACSALFFILVLPEGQRVDVKILTVQGYPSPGQYANYSLQQPFPEIRIAEISQL